MLYTLAHIVENSAHLFPDKEAFRCGTDTLTYTELDIKTNQLAKHLVDSGVKKGDRVGIYMNRCIETAIAIYGIMKAGAAYVPLDSGAPRSRTLFLIKDCTIQFLITTPKQKKRISKLLEEESTLKQIIGYSDDLSITSFNWDFIFSIPLQNYHKVNVLGKDLAYILYTSGSTGAPKGIMHSHNSGLAYAKLSSELYGLTPQDRVANHAPLHFDISTFGYFSAPLASATTVIVTDAHTKLPVSLGALISDEKISVWYSVPLALSQLLLSGVIEQYDFSSLRWVLYAGENFIIKHLKSLMKCWPKKMFSNIYGPTEVNQCTYYNFNASTTIGDYVPIGNVWNNTEYKILDSEDNEVKKGESGQLLIRTATMMLGYWNEKNQTEKSFFKEVVADNIEKVFYKTGDAVRIDENGELAFLGRTDRQIKLRGYRIELDEVEAVLERHGSVQEATACLLNKSVDEQLLTAAVILMPNAQTNAAELLSHCKSQLPTYAIPDKIDVLDEFPRTGSGKIDLTKIKETLIAL